MSTIKERDKNLSRSRLNLEKFLAEATVVIFFLALLFLSILQISHPKLNSSLYILLVEAIIINAAGFVLSLKETPKKNKAIKLIFITANDQKIGYSAFYNSNTDSTIITLLTEAEIAQTSLPGRRDENDIRIFLEKKLTKHHGDLSKFPVYKNLFNELL